MTFNTMGTPRNGSWIQTYIGIQFWPLDPRPEEIDIRDVAHALSLLCRFNGHCRRFYSVAEHSVHVSRIVASEMSLWGLLHDASEAYLSDVPQPVKQHLDRFHHAEEVLLAAVAERFGLPAGIPAEVDRADRIMLSTEKLVLMGREPALWDGLPAPMDASRVVCHGPEEAERVFLERFEELQGINSTGAGR